MLKFEILKLKFDQDLCTNLWYELNPRVHHAFVNVSSSNAWFTFLLTSCWHQRRCLQSFLSAMTLSTNHFETIKVFKKMSILLRGQMKSIVEEDVRCNLSHCPRAPYFPHILPYLASSEIGKCIKTPVRSINLHTTAQTAIHSLLVQKVTLDQFPQSCGWGGQLNNRK